MKIELLCSTLGKNEKYWGEVPSYLKQEGYNTETVIPRSYKLDSYEKQIRNQIYKNEYENLVLVPFSNADLPTTKAAENAYNIGKIIYVESILPWKKNPFRDRILGDFGAFLELYLPQKIKEFSFGKASTNKNIVELLLEDMTKKKLENFEELVEITRKDKDAVQALIETKHYSEKFEKEKSWQDSLNELRNNMDIKAIVSTKHTENWAKENKIEYFKISDSGHLPMLEKPKEFYEALNELITS